VAPFFFGQELFDENGLGHLAAQAVQHAEGVAGKGEGMATFRRLGGDSHAFNMVMAGSVSIVLHGHFPFVTSVGFC
jgi:hypothetical protein